jgi:serine/threonine protein kinase
MMSDPKSIVGTFFGQYRAIELIDVDRLGQVYFAVNENSDDKVILYRFLQGFPLSEEFQEIFRTTCEELIRYDHPNLAKMVDFGMLEEGGYAVYSCPDHFAAPLEQKVTLPISQKQASQIMTQVSSALEYVHAQNRIVGHLSLSTVWLGEGDSVWLCDFGLREVVQQEVLRLSPESYIYLGDAVDRPFAPEQILQREATFKTDIYALGSMYYRLLTGKLPHPARTAVEGKIKAVSNLIEWPKNASRLSRASINLIQGCMTKEPADRFKSTAQVTGYLEKISKHRFVRVPVKSKLLRGSPPSLVLKIIFDTLAVILIVGGLIYFFNNSFVQDKMQQVRVALYTPIPVFTATPSPTASPIPTQTQLPSATPLPTQIPTPLPTQSAMTIASDNVSHVKKFASFRLNNSGSDWSSNSLIFQHHHSIAFSPDSQKVAFSGDTYNTTLCNLNNVKNCQNLNGKITLGEPISLDSSKIAVLRLENVWIRGAAGMQESYQNIVYLITMNSKNDVKLGISMDGGMGGYIRNGNIFVIGNSTETNAWDLSTGFQIIDYEGGELGCQVMRVSYDLSFLSATLNTGIIEKWDDQVKNVCSYTTGMKGRLLAIAPDLNQVAYINQYGLLEVYDPTAKKVLWKLLLKPTVSALAFSPDSSLLVVGQEDGQVSFFNSQDGTSYVAMPMADRKKIVTLKFSPDSKYLGVLQNLGGQDLMTLLYYLPGQ